MSLVTAIAWLGSARGAVRDIAQLAAPPTNFLLLKLKDLGLAIGFGAALVVSAALSVGSTAALNWLLGLVGVEDGSPAAIVATRVLGLLLAYGLDLVVLAGLYRILAGVPIPARPLWQGAALGAERRLSARGLNRHPGASLPPSAPDPGLAVRAGFAKRLAPAASRCGP